ncbi:MAG TPA: ATP-dependent Clp protease ATP-binding subunit, partial [Myxococcaceae bacterium]|nr:ATP-dependent Clp protease ATP-binding subunit [Myxococcaceae bacterium]
MIDGSDLAKVLSEASDIARTVGQRMTSAHALLALFTVDNRGAALLRDRDVDEDRLLSCLAGAPTEPEANLRELREKAREIARSCGSTETDCLHLLIAMTRVRCAAQELLARVGVDLTSLRNKALSYHLSGRMPRSLQTSNRPPVLPGPLPTRRPGAPPAPLPGASTLALERPVRPARVAPPPPSIRDLVDPSEDEELLEAPTPEPLPRSAPAAAPIARTEPAPAPRPDPLPSLNERRETPPAMEALRELDPRLYPNLHALGRNLTLEAQTGQLDPVIGREKEIEEIIDILGKRRANNPCLVGEPGVGKTAVVEGVAQSLLTQHGPLSDRLIIELDMATLVAGTQLRGSFSERLNAIKDEVRQAQGRIVVFIDEIHTLIGAGTTGDGPQDAAQELKTAMARGEFPCIGATTHDEYRKFISNDPALERRFTSVTVEEPDVPQTVQILAGVKGRYEDHHQLRYSHAALESSASLAGRYIKDRCMPDKAIQVMDLAGSRARREGRDRVEPVDIARVVAKLAGVPEERLLMNDTSRLLGIEEALGKRVIGHAEAVEKIARVLRRNYAGFATRRPMGSFLFLGPTGVGKTEMARSLAHVLFGREEAMVRIDMSELAEAHAVSRLVGAPAGYVGYGDGGQLTEAVRRHPSSVVVLDEIEKAHPDVLMLLLQVLEEGRLTDGKGRHVDFSNTVVVMTTNLGADAFGKSARTL